MADEENVTPQDAAPVEAAPETEIVHPGTVTRNRHSYDVLDLTAPYNQSHDPVGGYFRVTALDNPDLNVDVVTDRPYVQGEDGTYSLSTSSEMLIKAAIDQLEVRRKLS